MLGSTPFWLNPQKTMVCFFLTLLERGYSLCSSNTWGRGFSCIPLLGNTSMKSKYVTFTSRFFKTWDWSFWCDNSSKLADWTSWIYGSRFAEFFYFKYWIVEVKHIKIVSPVPTWSLFGIEWLLQAIGFWAVGYWIIPIRHHLKLSNPNMGTSNSKC